MNDISLHKRKAMQISPRVTNMLYDKWHIYKLLTVCLKTALWGSPRCCLEDPLPLHQRPKVSEVTKPQSALMPHGNAQQNTHKHTRRDTHLYTQGDRRHRSLSYKGDGNHLIRRDKAPAWEKLRMCRDSPAQWHTHSVSLSPATVQVT